MSSGLFLAAKNSRHLGLSIVVFVSALAGLLVTACSEESSPTESVQTEDQAVVHTYTVRGRIVSLPDPAHPASELSIHHEAIDDFKNMADESAPMGSMTMPFPPGAGVSLDGLAVGDAVEFVFRVQWKPTYEMGATSITKLPAETKLSFE